MSEQQAISLESEAGFKILFESATIGILVVNDKGNIELSNPCADKLFGYEPAELIGKTVEVLIPIHLSHKHIHHREGYFHKPKTRPMGLGLELYARKKNEESFPVEISLAHYELDGEKLAVAFITDITERVKAKKIIDEREEWFRNMADNAPVMICVSGINKMCSYVNKTWLQFTGRQLEEELGTGWLTGVHPEDMEECIVNYNKACDARQPFEMEFRLRRHDGQYRWIRKVVKPTYLADHTFTGYVGSCNDIHDQRMMQEELELRVHQRTNDLNAALGREQELNELKSRFVSMASHEFRTPLSVVLSSTALISKYIDSEKDEKIEKHLLRIKNSVNSLRSILNDFLSLDKLEQGKVEVECDNFDLKVFMNDVIEDVSLLQKKEQRVNLSHQGEIQVSLDQKKLYYIMVNLISNSLKYSSADVHVHCENKDGFITVKVQDFGIGIPEEEQQLLFSKFFRAHNTGSIQGTGLGLTIVKRYVELMSGKISFTSKSGEGTTFVIQVPQSF
ncbi:PAS domain-containing sensor histidine kinase [Chryseolinea sp. H1M3-3]|uniref:sensor histidine kinase n=1 Tax=Chryseolinea sp. H1M3-3 TaxID=3034144 RepID=UPI0023ECD817|nr:PAS domain-containing sensor histidine kinase [Chryseolinea sp. H1M3-3]